MTNLERIAYHEAGHAVFAHYAYPGGKKVTLKSITIKADEKTAGLTIAGGVSGSAIDIFLYEAHLSYAGMVAEGIHFNEDPWESESGGSLRDIVQGATAIDNYVMALTGRLDDDFAEQCRELATQVVETVLRHYWTKVEALAKALLDKETLTGKEAIVIIKKAGQ